MDRLDLPKHIVEKVERRWAQKLQEQTVAWKSARSEARGATNRSSSRRSRQHGEAAQNYPRIGERAQVKRVASIKNPGNGSGVCDVECQAWAEAGSVIAGGGAGLAVGLTGSCRTVAVCPTAKSVTRTILPLANSSAS